mmetsp:Transcript_2463/g.3774  ORF Transcript_2463/g.3774 Transcript_2463/m.3774 type:complete len:154 (-) Transcript_2463:447-908(-)
MRRLVGLGMGGCVWLGMRGLVGLSVRSSVGLSVRRRIRLSMGSSIRLSMRSLVGLSSLVCCSSLLNGGSLVLRRSSMQAGCRIFSWSLLDLSLRCLIRLNLVNLSSRSILSWTGLSSLALVWSLGLLSVSSSLILRSNQRSLVFGLFMFLRLI